MTYHLRISRKKRPSVLIPYTVAGLVLLIILLLQVFSPRLLSGAITAGAEPLFAVRNVAAGALSGVDVFFSSRDELEEKIEKLEEERTQVAIALSNFETLQKENEELRGMLGRKPEAGQTVLAAILSKPPFSPYDTFLVDAGTEQGITVGATVRSERGIAIGKITEVNNDSSLVRLASSAGEKLQIALGTSTNTVEAEGKGGGSFEIKIPRGKEIKAGDPIYLPPHFAEFFAQVTFVEESPEDSFETVYFKLPVKLNGEKWVLIEKR